MTGYTVHTGATEKFVEGWDQIFVTAAAKRPKKAKRPAAKKKPAAKGKPSKTRQPAKRK